MAAKALFVANMTAGVASQDMAAGGNATLSTRLHSSQVQLA
jgi:hypothetical protein